MKMIQKFKNWLFSDTHEEEYFGHVFKDITVGEVLDTMSLSQIYFCYQITGSSNIKILLKEIIESELRKEENARLKML